MLVTDMCLWGKRLAALPPRTFEIRVSSDVTCWSYVSIIFSLASERLSTPHMRTQVPSAPVDRELPAWAALAEARNAVTAADSAKVDLDIAKAGLAAAKADLDIATAGLAAAKVDLDIAKAGLAAAKFDLNIAKFDQVIATAGQAIAKADQAIATSDQAIAKADQAIAKAQLAIANADSRRVTGNLENVPWG